MDWLIVGVFGGFLTSMKIDKSLQEVWDWKDKVYEDTKHLSIEEAAKKIHEDAVEIKKKYGLRLKTLQMS